MTETDNKPFGEEEKSVEIEKMVYYDILDRVPKEYTIEILESMGFSNEEAELQYKIVMSSMFGIQQGLSKLRPKPLIERKSSRTMKTGIVLFTFCLAMMGSLYIASGNVSGICISLTIFSAVVTAISYYRWNSDR